MKWVLALPLVLLVLEPLQAVPPKSSKAAHAKTAHSLASKAPAGRTSLRASSAHKSSGKSTGRATLAEVRYVHGRRGQPGRYVHVTPKPSYQTAPDPDRYQEIQKALADKGYFKGEPNGAWSGDSTDALRRFQADQKIDPDGKINAHTLIGLGLGPKHNGTVGNTNLVPLVQPPPEPVSAPPATEEPAITEPLPQSVPPNQS